MSEHAIEGKFADIELLMVHSHVDDGIRHALMAVLIRFDDRAAEPEAEWRAFFDRLASILASNDFAKLTVDDREVTLEPTILLPPGRPETQACFRHEGSLTTPDDNESASWIVLPPLAMKREFFEDLGLLEQMEKPARPPQPMGRRFVLVNLVNRPATTIAAKSTGGVAARNAADEAVTPSGGRQGVIKAAGESRRGRRRRGCRGVRCWGPASSRSRGS